MNIEVIVPSVFFSAFGLYGLYLWNESRNRPGGYPQRVMGSDVHPRMREWIALFEGVLFIALAVLASAGIISFGND